MLLNTTCKTRFIYKSIFISIAAGENETGDATPSKRSSNNILGYLREKNDHEVEFRKRELEMKKEELQLEKGKFELDKKERMQKLETEKQEKITHV